MNTAQNEMRFDPRYKQAATLFRLGADIIELGVTTRESFVNALIAMRQVGDEIEALEKAYTGLVSIRKQLSELAADYAEDHKTALDTGLVEGPDGTKTGTLHLRDDGDGYDYHLVVGKDRPRRISGDKMTQLYIAGLPKQWVRTEYKLMLGLACEAIRQTEAARMAEHPKSTPRTVDDYLAEVGLVRPPKREWTVTPM